MASSARQAGPARTTSSGLIWLKRVKNPVELHATAERVISRTPCACRSVALPSLIVFHDNDGLVTTLSVPELRLSHHNRAPFAAAEVRVAHPGWAEWVPHRQVHLRGLGGSPKRLAIDDLDRLRAQVEILKQPCAHCTLNSGHGTLRLAVPDR